MSTDAAQLLPIPQHVAVVMDGNGRWAQQRLRPRAFGHRAGVKAVRGLIQACIRREIAVLTLFAFSSENWSRPKGEVSSLMDLFLRSLRKEADQLAGNGVRLRFIGERSAFGAELQSAMAEVQLKTAANHRLQLNIAVNYGGRWDIVEAARKLAAAVQAGDLLPDQIGVEQLHAGTSLADLPDPDLLIRTGGEQRISNFLLWQCAYTELYFCDTLWPDFDEVALDMALANFRSRQRRFGGVPGTAPKPPWEAL
jgi:undecaprenyl diphosphate synthase